MPRDTSSELKKIPEDKVESTTASGAGCACDLETGEE